MKILVILGTKAQYIKIAPILKQMDANGIDYHLVYTGQHSETFDILERAFNTRPADDIIISNFEASTKSSFIGWTLRFWLRTSRRLINGEWRGMNVCVVHGDTMSTLFGAIAARLSGLKVAHIEAGLRSNRALTPFPEEIIRRAVSHLTAFHFTPDASASANLIGARGEVIQTNGNTLRDALAWSLNKIDPSPNRCGNGGYGLVSIHRNENLSNISDFNLLMTAVTRAAATIPLKFVLHPATRAKLAQTGWRTKLEAVAGLELIERLDYPDFVRLLLGSRLLMTDGGSNQEEAAMLGLPTLLLRRTTERPDGLGDMIELSHLQPETIQKFVTKHASSTWKIRELDPESPSRAIVQGLAERLA
ncbi:UDP-N-acetylglucosamine 2-epimerase [Stutzerimonas nitrititolerans]|uniref:UDP-N-acetylglucosamine 2-epimerase n=1 Tax=Stutzerimonas nitrititolerans TaxID=2482751 RepID=UPI002898891A|nr:UDP-N-acetylglucosamine 2-epimerase [Stutzerimonas nitrititolerans]